MPMVLYEDVVNKVKIIKGMITPKKVAVSAAWLKEARKVIPEIPDPTTGQCVIETTHFTVDKLVWHLRDPVGHRTYVIIDRKGNTFARH